MSTYHWNNASGGDWGFYPNWSRSTPSGPPGASDDAFIDLLTGTPYDVTVNSAESALSLTVNSADATLDVNSSLTIGTTLTLTAGALKLNSTGTIVGGTIIGYGMVFNNGTLSGVSYQGTLDLSMAGSRVNVSNGIVLTGAGGIGPGDILLTGNGSYLYFTGTQTLDNASVNLGASTASSYYAGLHELGSGGTLTLGPNLTITQAGRARLFVTAGSLLANSGTIDAALSGASFTIAVGGSFINQGTINAAGAGGSFSVGGVFTNQGVLSVSNGDYFRTSGSFTNASRGALAIGPASVAALAITSLSSFSNQGTITIGAGAALRLRSVFDQTDIGAVTNSGGTVWIDGTLDNTAAVLSTGVGNNLGTVALPSFGVVLGGTLTGGGLLSQGGTLSGATYAGLLDLSASNSRLHITNGINLTDLAGTGPGSVLLSGNSVSRLYFNGTQTLDNASISIGATGTYAALWHNGPTATLTLGPSLVVAHTGPHAEIYVAAGDTIIHSGTIDAGLSGGVFLFGGTTGGSFANQGAINISNGDYAEVAAGIIFSNVGTIALTSSGSCICATT